MKYLPDGLQRGAWTVVLVATLSSANAADAPAGSVDRLVACGNVTNATQRLACFERETAALKAASAAPPAAAAPTAPAVPSRSAPAAAGSAAGGPLPAPVPPRPDADATAPAAAASTAAGGAPAAVAKTFGAEQLGLRDRPADTSDQSIKGRITGIRQVAQAAFAVTLDNGQVWRHENVTLGSYLREGDSVTISKATLGTYRLTRDAGQSKNWIRVTRIR